MQELSMKVHSCVTPPSKGEIFPLKASLVRAHVNNSIIKRKIQVFKIIGQASGAERGR